MKGRSAKPKYRLNKRWQINYKVGCLSRLSDKLTAELDPALFAKISQYREFRKKEARILARSFRLDGKQPRYVNACEHKAWHVRLESKSTGEEWRTVYRCGSWRHDGECRRHKASEDFARIRSALSKRNFWVYMVLTYDQWAVKWRYVRERFQNVLGIDPSTADIEARDACYRGITRNLQSLTQWISRNYRSGIDKERPVYVAVVEQHQSGWPHVNLLVSSPAFCMAVQADQKAERQNIKKALMREGFGYVLWVEMVRDRQKMTSYLSKICAAGEVGKLTQAPIDAPPRFRRLRATIGLLPKKVKNEDLTGSLELFPLDCVSEPFTLYENRQQVEEMTCLKKKKKRPENPQRVKVVEPPLNILESHPLKKSYQT
jgi:hypothetical protein